MLTTRPAIALSLLLLALPSLAQAHPVPRRAHDRTIVVRLTADAVVVDYRLEVDPWTVVFVDLPAVSSKAELARLSSPREFYEAFTRAYGPILAANLVATLDGKPLDFTCTRHAHEVPDHLRCDFVFRAPWKPAPGRRHRLAFREGNYELESGLIDVSLGSDPSVRVVEKSEPEAALKERPAAELRPGDEERLRKASAAFEVGEAQPAAPAEGPAPGATASPAGDGRPSPDPAGESSLLQLFLRSEHAFWVLMVLAFVFGAAHALTPGHGKTLVAAYLVGERGTVWHALLLGLTTALTHTGGVLVIALALWLMFPQGAPEHVLGGLVFALKFVGGLMIAGLGFWLLLRRLAGQADHVHLGGGHHHHHHGHAHAHGRHGADHFHDEHGHVHPVPASAGWWGMVVLGVSGGIVPCWDAIALLLAAVFMNLFWMALPLLLSFSGGLAATLVAVGVAVVHAKRLAGSRWGESRLFRALPLVSAVLVTGLGLWLCYGSLQAHSAPPPAAHSRP